MVAKISVIGNACSGKTTLSRRLALKYQLPLTHVDSIQFLSGMKLRDPAETRRILQDVSHQQQWIIDGLGPLKIIEDRFQKSDLIIFIQFPIWINYWWAIKRQIKGIFVRRKELPEDCFEATLPQTYKLFKNIWNVHHGLWPQLEQIFKKDIYKDKVIYIKRPQDLENYV